MNSSLKLFFSSFNTHGVILDWNLWDVCSSNLVSLIRHWFTSYVMQQLGRGSSPPIVSGMTHTSTQYLSKHVASKHSFLLLSMSSSSSPPSPSSPPSLPLPWILDQKDEGSVKTHSDRQKVLLFFIHEIPQVDVCECRWKYKLDQMCLILLWNVITCSRNRHPPTENTGGRQI